MIQIALILLTTLALIVAAFLNFTPNFNRVVESDVTRLGYEYGNYRSLEEAQLMHRAGVLSSEAAPLSDGGYLYADNKVGVKIVGTVVKDGGQIAVQLNRESKPLTEWGSAE